MKWKCRFRNKNKMSWNVCSPSWTLTAALRIWLLEVLKAKLHQNKPIRFHGSEFNSWLKLIRVIAMCCVQMGNKLKDTKGGNHWILEACLALSPYLFCVGPRGCIVQVMTHVLTSTCYGLHRENDWFSFWQVDLASANQGKRAKNSPSNLFCPSTPMWCDISHGQIFRNQNKWMCLSYFSGNSKFIAFSLCKS